MKSLDSSIKAIDGQEQKRNYMILDMTRALMKKDREKFSRLIKTFFSQFKSEKDVTEDILTFCALIDTVVAHQCTEGNNMIQKYIRVLETEAKSMQSPLHKAKIYRTLALWHASATNRKKSEEYLDALQNVTGQHGIHSLDTDINRLKKQLS